MLTSERRELLSTIDDLRERLRIVTQTLRALESGGDLPPFAGILTPQQCRITARLLKSPVCVPFAALESLMGTTTFDGCIDRNTLKVQVSRARSTLTRRFGSDPHRYFIAHPSIGYEASPGLRALAAAKSTEVER